MQQQHHYYHSRRKLSAHQVVEPTASVAKETSEVAALCSGFYLDKWLVRPETNQLFLQDETRTVQTVQLEPRLMRLLCILAGNVGRLVHRDLLMDMLWPRVVVNENSLSRAVSDLRKALRPGIQTGKAQAAGINTVSKAGYSLVADVRQIEHPDLPQKMTNIPVAARQRPVAAMAAAMVLGLGTVLGVVIADRPLTGNNNPAPSALVSAASVRSTQIQGDVRIDQQRMDAPVISSSLEQHSKIMSQQNSLNSAIVSPDGEFFAAVDYNSSGSRLMLGSARQSSVPVVVYSTSELIYNVQWAPLEGLLLFAQKPKLSPASENADRHLSRLMMFDLETMTVTMIHKNTEDQQPVEQAQPEEKQYSNLT